MFSWGKKDSEYYFKQGEKLSRSDGDKALAMLEAAVKLDPHDAGLHFRIGSLIFSRNQALSEARGHGRTKEELFRIALRYLERAVQLAPQNSTAQLVFGNVLMKLGLQDEALCAFNHSIDANPRNAGAYNARGRALTQMHQYLAAMEIRPMLAQSMKSRWQLQL